MSYIIQQFQQFSSQEQQSNQQIQKLKTLIIATIPIITEIKKQTVKIDYRNVSFVFDYKETKQIPVITKWFIFLDKQQIKIKVFYINPQNQLPFRIISQRIKIQFASFIRKLNKQVPRQARFVMETYSGLIKYQFLMSFQAFNQHLGMSKKGFVSLLKYNFKQLSNFSYQILDFCGLSKATKNIIDKSQSNTLLIQKIQKKNKILNKLNKFKYLFSKTRYFSNQLQKFIRMRENDMNVNQNQQMNIFQSIKMYFQSLKQLNSYALGMQQIQKNQKRIEDYLRQQISVSKAHLKTKKTPTQHKNNPHRSKKAVWGIQIIDYRSPMIEISDKGAHSKVYKQRLSFQILCTINKGVYQEIYKDAGTHPKIQTINSSLAIKKCNSEKEASINSFKNQLYVLQHFRDEQSVYMARYYLQLSSKQKRDQDDYIYMQFYEKNLYQLIKDLSLMNLKSKICLAYRVAKGLCFLAQNSIIHRDIKLQNIVIGQDLCPKLIDFGSACPAYNSQRFQVFDTRLLCTQDYHVRYQDTPQQIKNKFSKQAYQRHNLFDVYSYGIILRYIFWKDIKNTPINENLSEYSTNSQFINNVSFLIDRCTHIDPDQRPGPGQIAGFLNLLNELLEIQSQV